VGTKTAWALGPLFEMIVLMMMVEDLMEGKSKRSWMDQSKTLGEMMGMSRVLVLNLI